ncbi:minichromosome maintenance protein MCM, partial [Candidatus Parvarchaeota archaeon]|nr:minichromosome maintenance protein MCM [Candidatus Parvarchaeota archaeon]
QINELVTSYPGKRSLQLDFAELARFDPDLADALLENPDDYLKAATQALVGMNLSMPETGFEPHVRVFNVPGSELMVQNISSTHIDKLIAVRGVVTKRAEVRHRVKVAVYVCSLCNASYKVPMTAKNSAAPTTCDSCKRQTLSLVQEKSYFVDLQKAEIQELLERLKGGAPTARLEIIIEDDMVNSFTPGDTLEFTGIMRITMPPKAKGKATPIAQVYSRYLEIVHVRRLQRDFEELDIDEDEKKKILDMAKGVNLYRSLIKSLAPDIYGHDQIKEALLLQVFGGTKDKITKSGSKIRDDIHVLLIGDPGAAKTRFLQNVIDLAPKSTFVSGKSVTGVGLTASAEKDELGEGGWTLKAGALVLASGGIVAIDEFDKIDDTERAAMHEVMESQTVSIAKAGIVAKFNAKTAILAAANPKLGRFDPNDLPGKQFEIPPTLLSRFDLIFPVFDRMDEEKDTRLAQHILRMHQKAATKEQEVPDIELIERPMLRKYVAYARKHIYPILTNEAADKIRDFYVRLRSESASKGGAVPITARQIEGLIRMSEASAKIRLSDRVEIEDAERAIRLVNYVLESVYMDKTTKAIDIDIVATGIPKSQKDRIQTVVQIIRQLQAEYDTVEVQKVVDEASAKYDIKEDAVKRIIDDLLYKGELYKKEHGHVKLVNP